MIVPKNVLIQNFLSIKEAKVALENQGLVLIEGVNEDDPSAKSNGSGKSSLVDAVSWCLFGQTARGESGDAVINLKAGKNTYVEIDLTIDGESYTIMRGRKHKTLRNRVHLRRGIHDLTLGTDRQTQDRINTLLGCSVETFNAAIYMGQENMPDLPNMTDKTLKAVLEEALSLNRLDDALVVCNDQIAKADERRGKVEIQIVNLSASLSTKLSNIKTIEDVIESLEWDIEHQREELKNLQEDWQQDSKAMQQEVDEAKADYDAAPDVVLNPHKIAQARKDKEVSPLVAAGKAISADLNNVKVNIMAAQRKLADIQASPDVCVSCNQPIKHDHTKEIEALTQKIEDLKEEAERLMRARQDYTNEIKLLEDDIQAEFERNLNDTLLGTTKVDAGIKYKAVLAAFDDFKARWNARYDRIVETLNNKKIQRKKYQMEIAGLKSDIGLTEATILNFKSELHTVKADLAVLGKVKYALGRKGFRGELLDQVTPYLNARTQYYLETLSDDNITATWNTIMENSDGDYVENFHIKVQHRNGVDRFALLSGGEKRKVRLACALALQDLVATRAVKPIKLFIADEIDDAIDESGLELLMGVLEAKAREMGSVFIISHNDLADWCRSHITVTKQDGVSTFKTPT